MCMINASPLETLETRQETWSTAAAASVGCYLGDKRFLSLSITTDTPSITAKLISEQKEDKEKKNHEEKEKMKADNGFQDNYSVVVASGTRDAFLLPHITQRERRSHRARLVLIIYTSSCFMVHSSVTCCTGILTFSFDFNVNELVTFDGCQSLTW